jgi:hypothetical protein
MRVAFVESRNCTSRAHCSTCRDTTPDGEAWRRSLSKAFQLPGDNVNFDCPFGVPWNEGALYQVTPMPGPIPVIHEGERKGCCGG